MTRIFPMLASFSLMLMGVAVTLGLVIGDLYADPVAGETLVWATRHRLIGVAAALFVVLVESIGVTYFIGTSRWCKEVTETYRLPPADLAESTRLKRRSFPWLVLGMLTVVGVSALGAASDPGTGRSDASSWTDIHLAAAFGGLCLIAWTYYRAWLNIADNQRVIERIVAQVRQIREERGLDSPALNEPIPASAG